MDTKDILISILTNKNETSITTIGKYLYKIIDTYKKLTIKTHNTVLKQTLVIKLIQAI